MNQSNPTLAKRIAELERQLSSTKDLLESSQLSEVTAKQYAEEVDKQNAALAAQVEYLKARIGAFSINIERNEKIGTSVKEEIAKLFIDVGENHLRQVRADSGLVGYFRGTDDAWRDLTGGPSPEQMTAHRATEYADSILAGKE